MNDEDLFQATVPVFLHYLGRIDAIVSGLDDDQSAVLAKRLAPDTFGAGEHFQIAQGYVLRILFLLVGRDIPGLSTEDMDVTGLRGRSDEVRALLTNLSVVNFSGAAGRRIRHTVGIAELDQDATDFATLYGQGNRLNFCRRMTISM